MQSLTETFGPDGPLAAHLPDFRFRAPQQDMAVLVGDAMASGRHAALEAGTGIGKTFAYLVPVLLPGSRAIVSTGTKTLQDQLFERDLPLLGRALGRPVDVALLKGRSNYLCWHRLHVALERGGHRRDVADRLGALREWGELSETGDLSEIEDLEGDYRVITLATSTADNCLGNRCEHFDECFVGRARRRAQEAQVVIVNHHLLLADLALKERGFGELLPAADVVVVDEAHLLPDIAQQFFGVAISSRELERLARDLQDEAELRREDELAGRAGELLTATLAVRKRAGRADGRIPWAAAGAAFRDALEDLRPPLASLSDDLTGKAGNAGLERCQERLESMLERLRIVLGADAEEGLRWFDFSERGFSAHFTPFDVASALAARIDAQGGTWICTSATLAVGDDFGHFVARVGIDFGIAAALPSPFDYEHNARLYLPEGLPDPAEPDHTEAFVETVMPLIAAAGGGAFVLFTSFRALHAAERLLSRRRLSGPLLVQGTASRTELLEQFREAGNAILLGTGSFWQGVDVRGPALRLVAIDKLPFAVPGDPVVQARIEAIRRAGGDPFREFQLPHAVLALKQGVGRLIRDFDDRGLVVLGDPRLRTRSYGKVFLRSLPPMSVIEDPLLAREFAERLADQAAAGDDNLLSLEQPADHEGLAGSGTAGIG